MFSLFRPISVAAGGYGMSSASSGFIRVNGNPLEQDPLKAPPPPPTHCPTSPYPGNTPSAAHSCTATANRELQCILKVHKRHYLEFNF